jgi:hypothetical protein
MVFLFILGNGVLTGCRGGTPAPPPDTEAPTVKATSPADGTTGVATRRSITATFSKIMNPATFTESTFILRKGGVPIAGTVVSSGRVSTFMPAGPLEFSTSYEATITTGVKDLSGNPMAMNYVWSFTTGPELDTTPPSIVSTDPMDGATQVPVGASVSVTFSEPMQPLSLNATTFTLVADGRAIAGTVTYSGMKATFAPARPLAAGTAHAANVTTGAKDLAGNPLSASFGWTFTTGAAPDILPPTVSSTVPARDATGVAPQSAIAITFSEAMEPSTITSSTILVAAGSSPVSGSVAYAGTTAVFRPANALASSTAHTVTVTTGVRDLSGNALATQYRFNFTTGTAPDVTPPNVVSTDPEPNRTGVPPNREISITFSEPMDPATLSGSTISLSTGGAPLPTRVAVSGSVATITPASDLQPSTTYTVTVGAGAKDLAGNGLPGSYSFGFTTGAAPDTTPPLVIAVNIPSGATGVPLNATLRVEFSEAMDPSTIQTESFTLSSAAGPAGGSVSYSGTTAVFTPASPLMPMTTYTAQIGTSARDLAGNALEAPFAWSFTTGAAPDTTPPNVTTTTPPKDATRVAVNTPITATFSEAMDPASLNESTFTLSAGASAVAGVVTTTGLTATFLPVAPLAYGTAYTATITTGGKDLAGNALPAPYVWTFNTATAPDLTPPTVLSTSPTDTASGVAVDAAVRATFSEAMDPSSLGADTFTLTGPGGLVAASVNTSGSMATLTPSAVLAYGTTYTALIATGARDLAGNPLGTSYRWSFTTVPMPDTTPPALVSSSPLQNALEVPLSSLIRATFSEPLDPATVTTATFVVNRGGQPIAGSVTVSAQTATFTPAARLSPNTSYVATVQGAVKDLAGNALGADASWSFTTGDRSFGPPLSLSGTGAGTPLVVVNASTQAFAVWEQGYGVGSVAARRYDPTSGWGPLELLENIDTLQATWSAAAVDPAGNAFVAWQLGGGTGSDLWVNRYVAGTGWTGSRLLQTDTMSTAAPALLGVDSGGNAIAVWSQQTEIWANRFSASAGAWGMTQVRVSDASGATDAPSLAVLPSGVAFAVWQRFDVAANNDSVWSSRFAPGSPGTGWSAPENVETGANTFNPRPFVAPKATGGARVVWLKSDFTRNSVWAARYLLGTGWTEKQAIETASAGDSDTPAVAVDPQGNAVAVWSKTDGSGTKHAWANRYVNGSWGTAQPLEASSSGITDPPRVALDAGGDGLVVWSEVDSNVNRIWVSRYLVSGGFSPPVLIETTSDAYLGTVSMQETGEAFLTWSQPGSVWVARFE